MISTILSIIEIRLKINETVKRQKKIEKNQSNQKLVLIEIEINI